MVQEEVAIRGQNNHKKPLSCQNSKAPYLNIQVNCLLMLNKYFPNKALMKNLLTTMKIQTSLLVLLAAEHLALLPWLGTWGWRL
jgi:hypothetical protein